MHTLTKNTDYIKLKSLFTDRRFLTLENQTEDYEVIKVDIGGGYVQFLFSKENGKLEYIRDEIIF